MSAWSRLAMARSGSGIAAIAASTALSPAALSAPRRASVFSARSHSFIAARSSYVNPSAFLRGALELLVACFVAFLALWALLVMLRSLSLLTGGSAQFVDADVVAGGVAKSAVADSVGLLGRLLDDLGIAGLQPGEGAVEVGGRQDEHRVGTFGHHLGD